MAARRKKPRSQYHHGDLRSALVATAWEVVARDGVEGLSLRAVAEALGVSHAAPSHHFRDKASLLAAVRLEAWERFADRLEAQAHLGLRATGRAYVAFARAHPRQIELMFGPGGPTPHAERAWNVLRSGVKASAGAKAAAADLEAFAAAAWATVHGLATLPLPANQWQLERVLDVVEAGITHA